jgi:hypothetical protein
VKEEDTKKKNEKLKRVIIILAILLLLSLIALAGTILYGIFMKRHPASVIVPDNIITPQSDDTSSKDDTSSETVESSLEEEGRSLIGENENNANATGKGTGIGNGKNSKKLSLEDGKSNTSSKSESSAKLSSDNKSESSKKSDSSSKGNEESKKNSSKDETSKKSPNDTQESSTRLVATEYETMVEDPSAVAIYIGDNGMEGEEDIQSFEVRNMFPGDTVEKYFYVHISFNNQIVLNYHADIVTGEDLASVLDCKIELLTTGETLYEGIMSEMPTAVKQIIVTDGSAIGELYYKITVHMDTNVGNEYQNEYLRADFRWWINKRKASDLPGIDGGTKIIRFTNDSIETIPGLVETTSGETVETTLETTTGQASETTLEPTSGEEVETTPTDKESESLILSETVTVADEIKLPSAPINKINTGDTSKIVRWLCIGAVALLIAILILVKRLKEDGDE